MTVSPALSVFLRRASRWLAALAGLGVLGFATAAALMFFWVLPNIAGHVGGDITAGILATRILDAPGLTLLLDIGTNGEMVLARPGQVLAFNAFMAIALLVFVILAGPTVMVLKGTIESFGGAQFGTDPYKMVFPYRLEIIPPSFFDYLRSLE